MGAITRTPIFKAWVQGEGYLVLILRRSRQSGSRLDRLANIYVFSLCYSTGAPQVNNMLSFGNLLWWSSYRSTYLLSFRNLPFMGKLSHL